jgi:hypothetical protein
MIQKSIDMPNTVITHAPFMISHHSEGASWEDSPVLKALLKQTVILLDATGLEFCGDVVEIAQEGITLIPSLPDSGWTVANIRWENIKHIYYC